MRLGRARPDTHYARSDGGYVAYQVFGEGEVDILFISGWMSNLDAMWDEPSLARYFDRLSTHARVICFDKRGSGVSDPVSLTELPALETWMDDARAAMDAVGTRRVAVIGDTEGGPMAMMLAATYPERVQALVLVNTFARFARDEDYPIGMPPETMAKLVAQYEALWGRSAVVLALTAPSVAEDPRYQAWYVRYQRLSMPPGASAVMYQWVVGKVDVRCVLASVQAPTLVLQRADAKHHRPGFGRYLAEHIPGARYQEVPGADTFPFHAGDFGPVLDHIESFLTGISHPGPTERVLSTVMFTDIVDSTRRAAALGDQAWLDLLAAHDQLVRVHLERFRGREVRTTGDGFIATFDGPTRAVRCAAELTEAVRALGLEIRAGLHTGEVDFTDGVAGGIAMHIAARVISHAKSGEVVVSSTLRDLVVGSGIEFEDRGRHALKGVPGAWPLYAVTFVP